MGGACSTYWEWRGAYRGNMRKRVHLEDTGVDGRVIREALISPY